MITIDIPYADGYKKLNLDEKRLKAVLRPKHYETGTAGTQSDIVRKAFENPINSPRLADLAVGREKVLVITSDHTRPVPSKITMPLILEELRSKNPSAEIKILIATGFHRATTKNEMIEKFGADICEKEQIINHDCTDQNHLVFKGILPSGGELWVNDLVDWADLVISEGFIEPHFFAGFSGGRKSMLPGIASRATIMANHCSKFIESSHARAGILKDNPIHRDMIFAAQAAGLEFIMNVVIDENKNIINAFSGHAQHAHAAGCALVEELARIDAVEADIVITSNGGYPLDQNIYQSVKGMTAAEPCVRDGGVIIIVSACNDGHGGEAFFKWFSNAKSPSEVTDRIVCIPQQDTLADQWQAQILARVLKKSRVIMVSESINRQWIEKMHMLYADTLEQALKMADRLMGSEPDIVVIPDGVAVIV